MTRTPAVTAAIDDIRDILREGNGLDRWAIVVDYIATLEAQPSPESWQTMDTAPKDGTPILGYKKWPVDGFHDCHTVFWGSDFGFCQLGGDERDPKPWQPTHWQPLPLPPTQGGE